MKDAHCSTEKKPCPGKPILKVAIGAITIWGIGMIWYGDLMFGKQWMALTGITPEAIAETMKTQAGRIMGLSVLNSVLASVALHALFALACAFTFCRRAAIALAASLLVGTVIFSGVIWEAKPLALFLIGIGYYATAFFSVAGMSSLLGRRCGTDTGACSTQGSEKSEGKDDKGGCCKH
jgi:hypothetical protein